MAMTTLERLRRDRGLDQVELAAQAGISQSTVSRAENGGAMTLSTARALARVFSITVEDLLDGPVAPDGADDLAATGS